MILNLICKINFKSGACDFSTENESRLELENNPFDELNSFGNIDEIFDPNFLLLLIMRNLIVMHKVLLMIMSLMMMK
ncbi:hypothetical protein A0H76_518 [Hepatospora eriocheir]|uniref:Uncharacterized protein n=1 Tax=Hepatospora eriocheir TaxID=1081669 RepID=A0A1X0Q8V3_9MICR|nr:hypothetical protein A0H76_518 [Hepatospora eriocheir]